MHYSPMGGISTDAGERHTIYVVTFKATAARIFLASPSDTTQDRIAVREALADWNVQHAADLGVVLLPVGWETDATPEWGDHPQAILNRQLLDNADALVGIFWTRVGTPTPEAESGTVEEIERFAVSGKPTLVYYCRRQVDLDKLDTTQLDALRTFEKSCREKSIHDSYGDEAELKAKVVRAMTRVARERFATTTEEQGSSFPKGTRLSGPPARTRREELSGYVESHGRNRRLVISNPGTVELRGVDVEIPAEASSFHLVGTDLPIDLLRPGERVGITAVIVAGGGKSIFDIWLTGQTEDGEVVRCPIKVSI